VIRNPNAAVLHSLTALVFCVSVSDCSSTSVNTSRDLSSSSSPRSVDSGPSRSQGNLPVARHLAWLDGNYQSDYEPDRKVAEERLIQWEGKIPSISDTENYLEYLSTLSGSSRAADAERRIKDYLAKYPNERRAVFLLGAHYFRSKKKELAQFLFRQLEKDPNFGMKSIVYNNLGMLALQEKNRQLALEYFEKATRAEPPTAAPFVNLGALYLQSRSWAEAEKVFARAANIDNDFEDAYLGWGSALEAQGRFNEAHQTYSDFISSHPGAVSVLFNDAIILGNRLAQREEAAQVMLRYIQRGGKETAKAHEIIQSWR